MLTISKEALEQFLGGLEEDGYKIVDVGKEKLPFKKFFLKPREELFSSGKDNKISVGGPGNGEKIVLFGLGLCDLEALAQLDDIMGKPFEDYFYFANRENSLVIGLVEEAIDAVSGGDIVFSHIGDNLYKVWLNTAKGDKIAKKHKNYFSEKDEAAKAPKLPSGASLDDWQKEIRGLLMDPEVLAKAVEWSRENHPIWDELAGICMGCGICTYVCPLCYCFSMEDEVGLDDRCRRCRQWAACTLPEFARISGGHNFRPTIKERYYNWFYHKFVRGYLEYGKSQCVGCGRCKKYCPAGIDILKVLKRILEDYQSNER